MERNKFIRRTQTAKSVDMRLSNPKVEKESKKGRYEYQLIPCRMIYTQEPKIYRLYADVVLMEKDDTLITEASLYNKYKIYKHAEIEDLSTQKVVRFHLESKDNNIDDWRITFEKLQNSKSANIRQWATPVKTFCERYEAVINEFTEELSQEKVNFMKEINDRSEKIRQTLLKTYPCLEFKSQLKDGRVQLTEEAYSEKYLSELGYTMEDFTAIVFQKGMPTIIPLDGFGASRIARLRLEKYLTTEPYGYQTPEFESFQLMKNGWIKKVRFLTYYLTYFDKGVPGFVFIGGMVSRQKPTLNLAQPLEVLEMSEDQEDFIAQREQEQADFLSMYYGTGLQPPTINSSDKETGDEEIK